MIFIEELMRTVSITNFSAIVVLLGTLSLLRTE